MEIIHIPPLITTAMAPRRSLREPINYTDPMNNPHKPVPLIELPKPINIEFKPVEPTYCGPPKEKKFPWEY